MLLLSVSNVYCNNFNEIIVIYTAHILSRSPSFTLHTLTHTHTHTDNGQSIKTGPEPIVWEEFTLSLSHAS